MPPNQKKSPAELAKFIAGLSGRTALTDMLTTLGVRLVGPRTDERVGEWGIPKPCEPSEISNLERVYWIVRFADREYLTQLDEELRQFDLQLQHRQTVVTWLSYGT